MDHFTKIHSYQDKTVHSQLALAARQVYTLLRAHYDRPFAHDE